MRREAVPDNEHAPQVPNQMLQKAPRIAAPDAMPEGVLIELAVGCDATDDGEVLAREGARSTGV